jgi:hypothetical protein
MMKVAITSVEQTVLQEDVLVEEPITLTVALTATIQTMIVLIIDTFYYEYCYVFCYIILLKTNKQLVHFLILHMFKIKYF